MQDQTIPQSSEDMIIHAITNAPASYYIRNKIA